MEDSNGLPIKKSRITDVSNIDISDSSKREQVDAHVQAFLKAVLDRAHGASRSKTSNAEVVTKKKRDASTQTDSTELCNMTSSCPIFTYVPNGVSSVAASGHSDPEVSNGVSNVVPNRSMYSQETLRLSDEQGVYRDNVLQEWSTDTSDLLHYYTADNGGLLNSDGSNRTDHTSPSEVRNAIDQWVQQYEQWFYQNFGIDVKSSSVAQQPLHSPSLPNGFPNPASFTTDPSAVISGAPVSYMVPEGSLRIPENHNFTPYVSLLPSFYSTEAFQRAEQQLPMNCFPVNQLYLTHVQQNHIPQFLCTNVGLQQSLISPQVPIVSNSHISLPTTEFPVTTCVPSTYMQAPFVQTLPHTPDISQSQLVSPPITDLSTELQTSAMLAALSIPVSTSQPNCGKWGPLLRYGTYGRMPSANESGPWKPKTESNNEAQDPNTEEKCELSLKTSRMPPPPPNFILLRRQAMICALQLSCRERARELLLREKEGISGIKIDYVSELNAVVEKNIDIKPVYLFSKLGNLPESERSHFIPTSISNDQHIIGRRDIWKSQNSRYFPTEDMYACDLLIGDVLIAEVCSTFKIQAQNCAARMAFSILSQPCFLVGSVRVWENVEYLVLCLSSKAELVPKLPPFLSDPFEPLSQKDRGIQLGRLDEEFDVVNPKPPDDLWLFLGTLPLGALDENVNIDRILAQSAEFSQMTISFVVEVNMETGLFTCVALSDNYSYPPVTCASLLGAQQSASKQLMECLCSTQPIVGLRSDCEKNQTSLWGVAEAVLVDSLMWGKEERDLAIKLEHLEAHCEVPKLPPDPAEDGDDDTNPFSSRRNLENLLQAYAAAALVTPLHISSEVVPTSLWSVVRKLATNWGLLSRVESEPDSHESSVLLICKRAPLPRLKRTLYDNEKHGCFTLLSKGNLSSDSTQRLLSADPLMSDDTPQTNGHACTDTIYSRYPDALNSYGISTDDDQYSEEPVTRLARHFVSTCPKLKNVKTESKEVFFNSIEDCVLVSAELNQSSNAIEILDDLPRTLIPGIDF